MIEQPIQSIMADSVGFRCSSEMMILRDCHYGTHTQASVLDADGEDAAPKYIVSLINPLNRANKNGKDLCGNLLVSLSGADAQAQPT
jgi:hypothetical protein